MVAKVVELLFCCFNYMRHVANKFLSQIVKFIVKMMLGEYRRLSKVVSEKYSKKDVQKVTRKLSFN